MNRSKKILESTSRDKFLGKFSDLKTSIYLDILLKITKPSNRIRFFLLVQGKFADDLVTGQITQVHDSLDLVTTQTDLPTLKELFYKANFEIFEHKIANPDKSFQAHTFIEDIGIDIYINVTSLDAPEDETTKIVWERTIDDVPLQFIPPPHKSQTLTFPRKPLAA